MSSSPIRMCDVDYDGPITVSVEYWWKEKAVRVIDCNEITNRNTPLNAKRIEADMRAGRFGLNGEAIIMNSHGVLDGVNRLKALIAADWSGFMVTVRGVPTDEMKSVDCGGARTLGHVLKINGAQVGNTNVLAGAVRSVHMLRCGRNPAGGRSSETSPLTRSEVVSEMGDEIEKMGVFLNEHASDIYAVGKIIASPARALGAWYLSHLVSADKANEFFSVLRTGLTSDPRHPARALRERYLTHGGTGGRAKGTREEANLAWHLIERTWRAHLNGERLSKVQAPSNGVPVKMTWAGIVV